MFENELKLNFFSKNGFVRKTCKKCGMPFWTQKHDLELCGDAPCVEYSFIGKPVTLKPYGLDEMRQAYVGFFAERGHTPVPRYSTMARWRNDIYLTIASIAVFQPHVTSGLVPPPANPLVISQPCVRLVDIMSVGKSGRHLSNFEMMAHHAFNGPQKTIYWKEETVSLCHEFMTNTIGIKPQSITYKENPWSGGGNAGPAVEVLSGGLELATLVFMNLRRDPAGAVNVSGETYSPMPLTIVDTGYGLERLVWASKGNPNIYDAIHSKASSQLFAEIGIASEMNSQHYKNILAEYSKLAGMMDITTNSKIKSMREALAVRLHERGVQITVNELSDMMAPIENVYAVTDHTRCLALLLSDGIVPSNVKAGYLARLVIRKALRHLAELGVKESLAELVASEVEAYSVIRNKDSRTVTKILELETKRYAETLQKGERIIRKAASDAGRGGKLATDALIELYDTHGVPPNMVERVCAEMGVAVEIPDAFMSILAEKHMSSKDEGEEESKADDLPGLPPTKRLYYENDNAGQREFNAVVLYSKGDKVVLDQTLFYPEGGGQSCDLGILATDNKTVDVTDVQKSGSLIVHTVSEQLEVGDMVHGAIDSNRRMRHTRHHTATHLIIGATRSVLGKHIWQCGSQVNADFARVDVTHYDRITDGELKKITMLANMIVMEGFPVEVLWMKREDAERKYGSVLFQGGVPPGESIRVVRISDFDAEACGGTQCKATNEIGPIKILKCYRIQDGIERIEFAAGIPAINAVERLEATVKEASDTVGVLPEQLPAAVKRFFEEWKALRKENESLKKEMAKLLQEDLKKKGENINGVNVVSGMYSVGASDLNIYSRELTKDRNTVVALATDAGDKLLLARGANVKLDCGAIIKDVAKSFGGSGGGKPDFAQCGVGAGKAKDALHEVLKRAKDALNA